MSNGELRKNFLVEDLFAQDQIKWVYSHYDRMMIGGAAPGTAPLDLETQPVLRTPYFLERREMGVVNLGGKGIVEVEGEDFGLEKLGGMYLGRGTRRVQFRSESASDPALFYLLSAPAHQAYPTVCLTQAEAGPMTIGHPLTANQRTIYKYIHPEGVQSCQLVMGVTVLSAGSVWNTMPTHVHDRRMEVYCYFDLPEHQRVLHLMGEPHETRHLWLTNHQAVISPPWSVHTGCGTSHYSFVWGMAGENQDYTDQDPIDLSSLR